MSTKAMRWAQRQTIGDGMAKAVLRVLADHSDHLGQVDRELSLTRIATQSEFSRRSVIRAIQHLAEAGFIKAGEQGRGAECTSYSLIIGGSDSQTPPVVPDSHYPKQKGSAPQAPGGAPQSPPPTSGNAGGSDSQTPRTSYTEAKASAAARDAGAHVRTGAPAGTHGRTREERLQKLNETAKPAAAMSIVKAWHAEHEPKYRRGIYEQMVEQVGKLLAEDCDPDVIAGALRAWHSRGEVHSPGALGWVYDDELKKRNAVHDPNRPLVDEGGHPTINPREIPDDYLTVEVLERMFGPDLWSPPPWPREHEFFDHPNGVPRSLLEEMREWQRPYVEDRLQVRRAEARRALIRSWNSRNGAAS